MHPIILCEFGQDFYCSKQLIFLHLEISKLYQASKKKASSFPSKFLSGIEWPRHVDPVAKDLIKKLLVQVVFI
jgi:hypothetical protein